MEKCTWKHETQKKAIDLDVNFFKCLFILREREREREREQVGEGQGETEPQAGSALSARKLTQGWNSRTVRS